MKIKNNYDEFIIDFTYLSFLVARSSGVPSMPVLRGEKIVGG